MEGRKNVLKDPIWYISLHLIFYSNERKRTSLKCHPITEYGPLTTDVLLKKHHEIRSPECTSFLTKHCKKKIPYTFCNKLLLRPPRNVQCPCRVLWITNTWYLSLANSCMSDHRVSELTFINEDWFFLADAPPFHLPCPLEGFPEDWWPPWSYK
jgi:hypothetical protein